MQICTCINIHEKSMYVYMNVSGTSTTCNDIEVAYIVHICICALSSCAVADTVWLISPADYAAEPLIDRYVYAACHRHAFLLLTLLPAHEPIHALQHKVDHVVRCYDLHGVSAGHILLVVHQPSWKEGDLQRLIL
jgi:hypothetical protein